MKKSSIIFSLIGVLGGAFIALWMIYSTNTVTACPLGSDNCQRLYVDREAENITRMYLTYGSIEVEKSECMDAICFVLDRNGGEWVIE